VAFGATAMSGMMDVFGKLNSFITASKQAKQDRLWQEYNNKMVRLQDGMNQGIITTNDLMRKDRKQTQLMQIAKSEAAVTASAEVSAASTGTVGRSVNAVLFDIGRNASNARVAVERDDDLQDVQSQNQRMQSALGAQLQIDHKKINGPSPASLLLGLGEGAIKMTQ